MSNILNSIKEIIASSIKVEVKSPINRNGKMKYPILVTDVGQSFTSGWFVQYNPVAQDNGTRLYDGSETFSELHISRFSELKNLIETANYYFLQGIQVEELSEGRKRAIYEINKAVRLTVTSQSNSVNVTVTIIDESSPFHMMSIPFTVVISNTGDGSYHVIGSQDSDRWDRNTDMFRDTNANFAPRKGRFYRVYQQQNQPASLRAKIAVNNGQYAINYDGTFAIDLSASAPEYIQVISNEYKALAYIYEQALMTKAFELALAQGLPSNAQPTSSNNQVPNPPVGNAFVPSFTLPGMGQPNPNPAMPSLHQQNIVPTQGVQQPISGSTPIAPNNVPPQGQTNQSISSDDLPWGTN